MGFWNNIQFRSPIAFNGSDRDLRHYENQSITIFDELFDSAFSATSTKGKHIELACDTEVLDTILIYLSSWFSMGIPVEKDANGNIIEDGPLSNLIQNPNTEQGKEEFMSEFYYYLLASGTNYILPNSDSMGFEKDPDSVKLLNLNYDYVIEPRDTKSIFQYDRNFDFKYRETVYGRQIDTTINFSEVIPFYDSINGISGKFYKGKSRMDSIRNELKNIRLATMAKQNKLDLSGITLVTPERPEGGMSEGLDAPLGNTGITQKQHIENRFTGSGLSKGRAIVVSSNQLKTMNLTEPLSKLDFDKDRVADVRTVKNKFGIPENILPITPKDATWENQEKSVLGVLQTMVEPVANNLASSITQHFDTGTFLTLDYRHLPAYSIIEKEKSESIKNAVDMVVSLRAGEEPLITTEEARKILTESGIEL